MGTRATAAGSWNDNVFISRDASLSGYDLQLHSQRHVGDLQPGESYAASAIVRIPDDISGLYRLILYTDSEFGVSWLHGVGATLPYPRESGADRIQAGADRVAEFVGEANNTAIVSIDVTAVNRPNLKVTGLATDSRVTVGEDFSVQYAIQNSGGDVADRQTPWTDRVYLSRDTFLDPASDHYLGEIVHSVPLAAGGTLNVDRQYAVPRGLTGTYYVLVQTDPVLGPLRPFGVVNETNDDDNTAASATPLLIQRPPPSDLQVIDVNLDTNRALVGGQASVSWTVENRGDAAATGRWLDAAYLSLDNTWDLGDAMLGSTAPADIRTLAPGETYSSSLTFTVPARLPGEYRILVRTDLFDDVNEGEDNRNNVAVSASQLTVDVREIRLNVVREDTLPVGGERLYRIGTTPGDTVRIDLTSLDGGGAHELYVRHEALPSAAVHDFGFKGFLKPDQSVIIPQTQGGTYYLLARGGIRSDDTGGGSHPIELLAQSLPFGITDVSPDRGGAGRYVTVEVEGARFAEDATVRLIRPKLAELAPVSIQRIDATRIIAVFDLRGAPLGLYDVAVINPDGSVAIDPYRFQLENADDFFVDVGVGGKSQIDIGEQAVYGVSARNLANIDTPYTQLEISVPRIKNPDQSIIPGEAIVVHTALTGSPSFADFDFSLHDPLLNRDGVYTSTGLILDLPTERVASTSIIVDAYPGVRELLEEDPNFLRNLDPTIKQLLAFDFYVAAAATPLTAAEYKQVKRDEAEQLRLAVLADNTAPLQLLTLAGNAGIWSDAYLAALTTAGLLRAEDLPPVADGKAQVVAGFFVGVAGLLGGFEGEAILAELESDPITATARAAELIDRFRGYAGHTPDAYGVGSIPSPEAYDLGTDSPASLVAFQMHVGPGVAQNVANTSGPNLNLDGVADLSESVALVGPTGVGDANYIPVETPVPYSIVANHPLDASARSAAYASCNRSTKLSICDVSNCLIFKSVIYRSSLPTDAERSRASSIFLPIAALSCRFRLASTLCQERPFGHWTWSIRETGCRRSIPMSVYCCRVNPCKSAIGSKHRPVRTLSPTVVKRFSARRKFNLTAARRNLLPPLWLPLMPMHRKRTGRQLDSLIESIASTGPRLTLARMSSRPCCWSVTMV